MGARYGARREDSVAVAIDKDKGSQYALKWTVDNLLSGGQPVTLLHVNPIQPSNSFSAPGPESKDSAAKASILGDHQANEFFLPFRCFCTRKDIKCTEVILEDTDVAKAIINYVLSHAIDTLVLGAPSRSGLVRRFRATDVSSTVSKGAPDFCTVYVISKGKISSVKSATGPPPTPAPTNQLQNKARQAREPIDFMPSQKYRGAERAQCISQRIPDEMEIKSPFSRRGYNYEPSQPESDISFVSSGRSSVDRMFPSYCDNSELGIASRLSSSSEYDCRSFASSNSGNKSTASSQCDFSLCSQESGRASWSAQSTDDMEAEMRRLRLELKQTMDLYSNACKEALTAKQKARELHQWKLDEEQRLQEVRLAGEAALAMAEKEKAKCKAAIQAAEAAKRIAELEAQRRMNVEMKAVNENDDQKSMDTLAKNDPRYRRYTIEEIEAATDYFAESRKIGEGGYGPVYKCNLDHTPVAVKVLRPDAAQGRSQFQQEVEVLSSIRHPNMVLLLGACPEYGCLVYEYMANGSLEDRLFRRGNSPVLPWQLRFQIAAEIGTGLLFLHQSKPEPLVHRDLKPANILLDRNYVSKISDVGLARLVPSAVTNAVTQYRMTSAAGTFCYIDPEYQQTGMLGIKSDIYSLGIIFLQLITAKPPMGLTHHVEQAIENGTFADILDKAVTNWPIEDMFKFAKLALQCAELRRKDRPDLGKVVLPELNRLRALAEESMPIYSYVSGAGPSPRHNQVSISSVEDMMSDLQSLLSGYDSSGSHSSMSSSAGR